MDQGIHQLQQRLVERNAQLRLIEPKPEGILDFGRRGLKLEQRAGQVPDIQPMRCIFDRDVVFAMMPRACQTPVRGGRLHR